ncbi:uncharacterized protein At4g02000-like [Brassica napus]|uniref:uncharacterized protein At4g02000-like n=1 Tax=Brassica napus TaxID=3708 RepID=UPI0006AAFFA8|nr:uncharacterized protein At4g02000-like [Brassica napus]
MWSLIPFLTDHWKCATRPIGSDLGEGKFQFQFSSKEDMQMVLDNRPYHFAHWMIILEQWEATTSPSFPSKIPFWIQVLGVPVHLWNEAILKLIGEDIGWFICGEITATKARLRAHINGLLPLMKAYTLEFSDRNEVVATLLYEKLEKHCTLCQMLDHEESTCPQKPSQTPLHAAPRHSLPPPPTRGSTPTSSSISGRRDVRAHFSKYPKPLITPGKHLTLETVPTTAVATGEHLKGTLQLSRATTPNTLEKHPTTMLSADPPPLNG